MLVNSASLSTFDTIALTGKAIPLNTPQLSVLNNIVRKVPILGQNLRKNN